MRVFWLAKAKLRRVYDESSEAAEELQRAEGGLLKLEAIDFGKRMATERTLSSDETAPPPNAVFDSSGNFLIYPTMLGIKVSHFLCNIPLAVPCESQVVTTLSQDHMRKLYTSVLVTCLFMTEETSKNQRQPGYHQHH